MYSNPYSQYKQTAVETASPERLVVMLYDGAIKFLRQAKEANDQNKIEDTNHYICKAQDIINEFIITLDMNAGEIAQNLHSIYDYWNRQLIQANIKKDSEMILEVLEQVEELREAWVEATTKYRDEQPRMVGGVNIEG